MKNFTDPIPLDQIPTRLHSVEAVTVWHARRVILDSLDFAEAADRLGISRKTLWTLRTDHGIREMPTPISQIRLRKKQNRRGLTQ